MYQFFVENGQITGKSIIIEGSDVNHIRNVLRMKTGEKIRISVHEGSSYFCEIAEIAEDRVTADVLWEAPVTELGCEIILFQGLPKSDKMEWVVQKAVELGAAAVVPVEMKRCVVKLDAKKKKNKVSRWQAIAESAAKQSKRSYLPQIYDVMTLKEAAAFAKELDVCLVPYENERGMAATKEAVSQVRPGQKVGIFIGPEGGFDENEIGLLKDAGGMLVSLGKRILRTETAGLVMLSFLIYELED
jgi:16S rRNA (uracil1498-N3)-methyltransferase